MFDLLARPSSRLRFNYCCLITVVKKSTTTSISRKYGFGYISVPIAPEYQFKHKSLQIAAFAGSTLDWIVYRKRSVVEYDDQNNETKYSAIGNVRANKPIVFNTYIGASIGLPLNRDLSMSFEIFNKRSSPIFANNVKETLQSTGVGLSLGFAL
jgi:hypothetical protein